MAILYFLFLFSSTVSGFLVQNGYTGSSSSQTSADKTVQNLLNLIVNEQNSRLQLQNIVTTLSNTVDKKLNEMSARLVQMEQFNTEVSKQLDKEKNNREHLEEMYTVLEKRVNNLTMESGTSTSQSERRNIEMTLNNLTSLFTANRNSVTDVNMKLVNLTSLYTDDFKVMEEKLKNLTNSSNSMHDKLVATETKLGNITRNNVTPYEMVTLQASVTQNQQELVVINSTLSNIMKNVTINGLNKHHEAVGFSVNSPDTSSAASGNTSLKYRTLIYNTGNGYNMSTGVFTCQYPGLYFFTATMYRSPRIPESFCYFYVNNHEYNTVTSGTTSQEGYMSGTQSIVYMLNVGDRVYLSDCVGTDHMYDFTSFSGFLISN